MGVVAGLRNRDSDMVGVFPANYPRPALGCQSGPKLAHLVDVASLWPRFAGTLPHYEANRGGAPQPSRHLLPTNLAP